MYMFVLIAFFFFFFFCRDIHVNLNHLIWMFEREHLQVFKVYPPGMDKSGIPGKWFFSELVFKGLVDYLSTED